MVRLCQVSRLGAALRGADRLRVGDQRLGIGDLNPFAAQGRDLICERAELLAGRLGGPLIEIPLGVVQLLDEAVLDPGGSMPSAVTDSARPGIVGNSWSTATIPIPTGARPAATTGWGERR